MQRLLRAALCALAFPVLAQPAENVTQLGSLDLHSAYNDVWGYTDEFGREFAILGTSTGTSIVDVTIPGSPVETGFIAGSPSLWRDMKSYGDYAYVVTEGAAGFLQIIDLSDPDQPQELPPYLGFETAHNLWIEEATARAYICGMNIAGGGVHVLDLSNPASPQWLGDWSATYVHDLYVRDGIGYLAEIYEPSFTIVDFANPANILTLPGPIGYDGAFTHNSWIDDAGDILFTTDENAGGHVQLWDIAGLPTVTKLGDFQIGPPGAIVHNVQILGDFGYVSYYTEGLRVFEFSDPSAPGQIGAYDTHAPAETGYMGAWGVYPFLPSGNILVSDIEDGLHIFELGDDYGLVQGQVVEDGLGVPLQGVELTILQNGKQYSSSAAGTYTLSSQPGAYTVRARLLGFYDQEQPFVLSQGMTTPLDISLVRKPSSPLLGTVRGEIAGSKALVELEGAQIELVDAGYSTVSGAGGAYELPVVPHGSYTLRARHPGFGRVDIPLQVAPPATGQDITLQASSFYDDADANLGWSVGLPGDTATRGRWVRAVPVPSNGGVVQPGYDATPGNDAGRCFVTGNAPSPDAATGAEDVDDGYTTLLSPRFDVAGMTDPYLAYARWYVNEGGAFPGQDVFTVEISSDDGANWTLLEQLGNDHVPWTRVDFRIADYVALTSDMRVRFIADDAPQGSIVEALIDDFEVFDRYEYVVATPPPALLPGIRAVAPNPFNPSTRIQFAIERPGPAKLAIVDLRGRVVATLLDAPTGRGVHSLRWDGTDAGGDAVASGVYLAILRSADGQSAQKLSLVK